MFAVKCSFVFASDAWFMTFISELFLNKSHSLEHILLLFIFLFFDYLDCLKCAYFFLLKRRKSKQQQQQLRRNMNMKHETSIFLISHFTSGSHFSAFEFYYIYICIYLCSVCMFVLGNSWFSFSKLKIGILSTCCRCFYGSH